MKRVYVAGKYSDNNVMSVLGNIGKGIRISLEVFLNGMAPFSPWLDYQYVLMLRESETLSVNDFYEYSKARLKVSDAMLVIPGYEDSKGTLAEIELSKELKIPIFYKLEDLLNWKKLLETKSDNNGTIRN